LSVAASKLIFFAACSIPPLSRTTVCRQNFCERDWKENPQQLADVIVSLLCHFCLDETKQNPPSKTESIPLVRPLQCVLYPTHKDICLDSKNCTNNLVFTSGSDSLHKSYSSKIRGRNNTNMCCCRLYFLKLRSGNGWYWRSFHRR